MTAAARNWLKEMVRPPPAATMTAAASKFLAVGLCLSVSLIAGCAAAHQVSHSLSGRKVPADRLEWIGTTPILTLSGTPYEMGYQHGSMLKSQVRASVAGMMGFVDREAGFRFVGGWLARWKLERAWKKMKPHVPADTLEELRGLSDGAGIPLAVLERIHALPEMTANSCASFAAFGPATKDGRLIQIRNLDWAIQSGVQQHAAIFVTRPKGKIPFINIGWAGFIGLVSGINGKGISVSEIGAETVDRTLKGLPMPFLLRRVLEESEDLEQAVETVQAARRTGGYNYVFADAVRKRAVALETTRSHCAVFWMDGEPQNSPHQLSVLNTIFRSDWAVDPVVRDLQRACRGDPTQPGLESPEGTSSYDVRYRQQGELLFRFRRILDPEIAMVIARAIAPDSNIQSVVYAYPQVWIANATGRQPAAMGTYLQLDVKDLLKKE